MPSFFVTLSRAPDVGMLLAAPLIFYFKKRCDSAARTAIESEGVTKNFLPRIMLRSKLDITNLRLHHKQLQKKEQTKVYVICANP